MNRVRAVVLDWAGTMIDFGCLAPAKVFQKVFKEAGVEISVAQAREPMGMAKRQHIEAIMKIDDVHQRWTKHRNAPPSDNDVSELYEKFIPLQSTIIADYCELIPGALDTFQWCGENEIRVASSTGYTRSIMEVVSGKAAEAGYDPEIVLCADDAENGRPAPWLIFEACRRFNIYPMSTVVKVDDTVVGVEAGKNAGAWSVGVYGTGNLVGCSEQEFNGLEPEARNQLLAQAKASLEQAGADFVIESVVELPAVITTINQKLSD